MKYIVFENGDAIIFADSMDHKFTANDRPVRSAGFCQIETFRNQFDDIRAKIACYGESLSLNKKSQPDDHLILERIWN